MASAPGPLGTSLTDRSCGVIGSHSSGYPLSLFLAKTLNAEIRRSNSAMPCCRDMDPTPSKKLRWGLPGGWKNIYQGSRQVPECANEKSKACPTSLSATTKTGQPKKASRQCSKFESSY